MIIRATHKVLKLSAIKPEKTSTEAATPFPGEWYVNTVSQGRPGKLALHFMHYPTLLSVLVPGRSINKSLPQFYERLGKLLQRSKFVELTLLFEAHGSPEIFTTNSKRMLGLLNACQYTIEYHLRKGNPYHDVFDFIEDLLLKYIHKASDNNNSYISPLENLDSMR